MSLLYLHVSALLHTGCGEQQIKSLLAFKPTLVRGNASEIMALAGASATGRGVDSTADSQDALEMGRQLARTYETVVAITGAVDLVRLPLQYISNAVAAW